MRGERGYLNYIIFARFFSGLKNREGENIVIIKSYRQDEKIF